MKLKNRIKQAEELKEADTFQMAYVEPGETVKWIQEDKQCLDPFICGWPHLDPEVGYIIDICRNCQERQEDEDYARICADEKWRSNYR